MAPLLQEVDESPFLELFKQSLDVVLKDVWFNGVILVVGGQLDWVILDIFSNLGDSMIL